MKELAYKYATLHLIINAMGYWQCKTLFRLTGYDIIGEWKSSVQKIIKKLKKQENC